MSSRDHIGILSIFNTVDGECNFFGPGVLSCFVRTRGCTVGCHWCDTKYSWPDAGGKVFSPSELVKEVNRVRGRISKITLTGGEPLEQHWDPLSDFLAELAVEGVSRITIETAGTQNVNAFRYVVKTKIQELLERHERAPYHPAPSITFIVDWKLSSSKAKGGMDVDMFRMLMDGDVIKFVIDSWEDFLEAKEAISKLCPIHRFQNAARMYLSPSHGNVSPDQLLSWMRDDEDQFFAVRDVRLNVQMHKYIFDDDFRDEEVDGVDYTKRTLGREEDLRRKKTPDEDLD